MAQESSVVEQAIVRALRDNLERIQRSADELHHAVSDVVSACASNKPTNALPSLLRAQTSAASLAATLEVLSRFVAVSMQTGPRSPFEAQITDLVGKVAPEPSPAPQRPAPSQPVPKAAHAPPAPPAPIVQEPVATELELHPEPEPLELIEPAPAAAASEPEFDDEFDVNRLSSEEQELHRRANRVAKVSMQDIKMLRPEHFNYGPPGGLLLSLDGGNPGRRRRARPRRLPVRHACASSLIERWLLAFVAPLKMPYYSVSLCHGLSSH
jgi:hypothetical protein